MKTSPTPQQRVRDLEPPLGKPNIKLKNPMFLRPRLGQVSLESSVAIIITILLLMGATYIFVWLNKSMIERQEKYRSSRDNATTSAGADFYTPEELRIFGGD